MINKNMDKKEIKEEVKVNNTQKGKTPNESFGFYFSSSIKISDKNSGEIILQARCD